MELYHDLERSAAEEQRKTHAKDTGTPRKPSLQRQSIPRCTFLQNTTRLWHFIRIYRKKSRLGRDSLEDMSFGIYQPHFTFETPEEYKKQIETLREQQKTVVRDDRAGGVSHSLDRERK